MSKTLAGVLGLTSIASLIAARFRKPTPTPLAVHNPVDSGDNFELGDVLTDGMIVGTFVKSSWFGGIRCIELVRPMGVGKRPIVVPRYISPHHELSLRLATDEEVANACEHGSLAPRHACLLCDPVPTNEYRYGTPPGVVEGPYFAGYNEFAEGMQPRLPKDASYMTGWREAAATDPADR